MAANVLAHDQTSGGHVSVAASITGTPPSVGDLVVAFFSCKAKKTMTVSDDAGNTYNSIALTDASVGGSAVLAWSFITAVPTTLTGNAGSGTPGGWCWEIASYPGSDFASTTADVIVGPTAQLNTSSPSIASGTLGQADERLIGGIVINSGITTDTLSVDAPWATIGTQQHSGSTTLNEALAELDVSSAASVNFSSTTGSSTDLSVLGLVSFKLAASGPTAYNLPIGHIATAEAVRGLALSRASAARSISLGHIASGEQLYGLVLTDTGGGGPTAYTLDIGHIASGETLRGLALARPGVARSLALGHVASAEAVRGLALTRPGVARSISLGHIGSLEAVRGLTPVRPAVARSLALGHIPSGEQLYGLVVAPPSAVRPSMFLVVPLYTSGVMVSTLVGHALVPLAGFDASVEPLAGDALVPLANFDALVER